MPIFWNPGGRPPLRNIYRDLIKLRKQNAAFYNGEVVWLTNSAPGEVVSILRRDAKDEFLVVINLSSCRVNGSVELSNPQGFDPVKIIGRSTPIGTLLPNFSLSGYEWCIYHRAAPQ